MVALGKCERRGLVVGDELQQRPVWIAEVDALALAACAVALDGSFLDRDAAFGEMRHGATDRAVPDEAQVAIAGLDRDPRNWASGDAGAMDLQLLCSEAVRPPWLTCNELGAKDIAVEAVRSLPIRHGNNAMIQSSLHATIVTGPSGDRCSRKAAAYGRFAETVAFRGSEHVTPGPRRFQERAGTRGATAGTAPTASGPPRTIDAQMDQ